jgi:hypothetical protein
MHKHLIYGILLILNLINIIYQRKINLFFGSNYILIHIYQIYPIKVKNLIIKTIKINKVK